MSLNVKEGYPEKLSSQEIKEEISKLKQYSNGGGWKYEIIIAANIMIQTGQAELNDRFTKRYSQITLVLTVLTIIAAAISIYFGFRTDRSDSQWKEQEINLLQSINKNIAK